MILHTLNQGSANTACLSSCLEAMQPGDSLLLIEDGVYWSLPACRSQLNQLDPSRIYVLQPDAQARGIEVDGLGCVDDAGFVELCVTHSKIVSWF